ncbi:Serine carboxypeptidase [Ceratobasidium sp. AG-Ba]|nr:Serine carboxypeptidase [Ceratobasidium sp. AG-Ba]
MLRHTRPRARSRYRTGTKTPSRTVVMPLDSSMRQLPKRILVLISVNRVTDKCPTPRDNLEPYFSRADVQKALHFDNFGNWSQCSNNPVFVNNTDNSNYSETLFPDLLTQFPKGFSLWHGLIDSILLSEGTRITIQNLTWGGYQGFQKPITTPWSVNGTKHGLYHTERKLTYIEFDNAGHMIPQDQPEAALHAFKWVLNGGAL